jgi:hypothetical protein
VAERMTDVVGNVLSRLVLRDDEQAVRAFDQVSVPFRRNHAVYRRTRRSDEDKILASLEQENFDRK